MMGMQTMQAQQPMQGGGKNGSALQLPSQWMNKSNNQSQGYGNDYGNFQTPPMQDPTQNNPEYDQMMAQYLPGLSGQRLQDYNAAQQQQQGAMTMGRPQQPMPQDMGRGYGMNREHRQGGGEGGGYGGELPLDYVGNTAQQQPMQGGGKAAGGMGQSMGQQPRFGQPNRYSNTTQQPWDNANINQQPSGKGAGGKGGGMQQGGQMQGGGKGQAGGGYPTAQTNFGQGAPLTQALPTANTANLGQVDDYSAPMSGGQGA
jgi:hypothetical protein